MISLRGVIRHVSVPKNITDAKPNQAPPSPTSGAPFDPLSTQQGEWVWTGHWAFGNLPSEEDMDRIIAHGHQSSSPASPSASGAVGPKKRGGGRKRPVVGVRPFMYKFEKIVEAKDVMVPSSLINEVEEDDVEEETGGEQENIQGEVHNGANVNEASRSLDGGGDEGGVSAAQKEHNESHHAEKAQLSNQDNQNLVAKLENKMDVAPTNASNEKIPDMSEKGHEEKTEIIMPNNDVSSNVKEISMEVQNQQPIDLKEIPSDSASNRASSGTQQETSAQKHDEKERTEKLKEENSRASLKTAKMSGSSFAEVIGGTFTDAARTSYPDTCPIGGCWKGYFENISVRLLFFLCSLYSIAFLFLQKYNLFH